MPQLRYSCTNIIISTTNSESAALSKLCIVYLMCFIQRNDSTYGHALLQENAQIDIEQGASSFWGDAWAREVNDGKAARLEVLGYV